MSPVVSQVVNKLATSTALVSSVNPLQRDQTVTFTATVSAAGGTPTGSVTFRDGRIVLGTAPLNSGEAKFSTSTLTVGSHVITAQYGGDGSFGGSTSPPVTQQVNRLFPSKVVVTSSPNPSTFGQDVVFRVSVTSIGGGTPTGSVTISEGASIYGSSPLTNGVGIIHVNSLTVGGHVIAATYGGDATHMGATSPTITQQVNP